MTHNGDSEAPVVSMRTVGLKIANLECPTGGRHAVPDADLARAVKDRGGSVLCIKCRQRLTVEGL